MDPDVQDRLTQIETHLSRLFDSRHEIMRYYGAAFRYFLGILRDLDEAMVSEDWPGFQDEETLLGACRDDVLARTWEALAREDKQADTTFHTILKFKIDHPDMRTRAMAERLGEVLKKRIGEAALRQAVHRARSRFAELLLEQVAARLGTRDRQKLEDELVDLKLLDYCRSGLDRWRP